MKVACSAREAALYDRAADTALAAALPALDELFRRRGHRGRVLVVKNNLDTLGNTYGCHENYQAERETDWNAESRCQNHAGELPQHAGARIRQQLAAGGQLIEGMRHLKRRRKGPARHQLEPEHCFPDQQQADDRCRAQQQLATRLQACRPSCRGRDPSCL